MITEDRTSEITLEEVKHMFELEIKLFEDDFEDKDHGEKAKLLCKHYKRMLTLLEHVK